MATVDTAPAEPHPPRSCAPPTQRPPSVAVPGQPRTIDIPTAPRPTDTSGPPHPAEAPGSPAAATLIGSVQRAMRLLETVATHVYGAPAKQLARETGLALPTAYHLLRTLVHEGY
ncbi:helix-turn-helix domain-containing protein, partial [Streptomyces puniciscabiei]